MTEYHTKINMLNFLVSFYTLIHIAKYIVQYPICVNLCVYNHSFTLNASLSEEFGEGKNCTKHLVEPIIYTYSFKLSYPNTILK